MDSETSETREPVTLPFEEERAQVLKRYRDLVDQKHASGLAKAEQTEMDALGREIDGFYDEFYEPIIEDLRARASEKRTAVGENTAMTITLEITPDLEEVLRESAEREGVAPDRYVLNLLRQQLKRHQTPPLHLPREEAELLQKINRGLPEATWERYRVLKLKRDDETLTPEEHAELIALTDAIEGWNVQRLEIVSQLARLRGVELPEMMKQLGLVPPSHAWALRFRPHAGSRHPSRRQPLRVLSLPCRLRIGRVRRGAYPHEPAQAAPCRGQASTARTGPRRVTLPHPAGCTTSGRRPTLGGARMRRCWSVRFSYSSGL